MNIQIKGKSNKTNKIINYSNIQANSYDELTKISSNNYIFPMSILKNLFDTKSSLISNKKRLKKSSFKFRIYRNDTISNNCNINSNKDSNLNLPSSSSSAPTVICDLNTINDNNNLNGSVIFSSNNSNEGKCDGKLFFIKNKRNNKRNNNNNQNLVHSNYEKYDDLKQIESNQSNFILNDTNLTCNSIELNENENQNSKHSLNHQNIETENFKNTHNTKLIRNSKLNINIANSIMFALYYIRIYLFVHFQLFKRNHFKYQFYLLLFILQLFTITPNALGYNSNNDNLINNRTLQQLHQQQSPHHYLISSSAALSSSATLPTQTSSSSALALASSATASDSTSTMTMLAKQQRLQQYSAILHEDDNNNNNDDDDIISSSNSSSGTSISTTSTDNNSGSGSGSSKSNNNNNNNNHNNNYEFMGRENVIRREPNLSYTASGCHSCSMREQAKADNLASIKKHILMRLKLDTMPNITSPNVPREIIEKFYKNNSNMFNRHLNNKNNNNNNRNYGGGMNGNRSGNDDGLINDRRNINIRNGGDLRSSLIGGDNGHRVITSRSYDGMQGDDPRMYGDSSDTSDYNTSSDDENANEDYEEEFYSVVNSLFVFPTVPRMRHNRKPEILHFSFTNDGHSTVSQATLHVYIRGRDWIREYEPSILNGNNNNNNGGNENNYNRREIVFTINRVLRRQNSPNSTHTQKVTEIRQVIPNGLGTWITVDVTDMVSTWYNNPSTNFGVVIKTSETWMKNIVVTDDTSGSKSIYIEILTKDNRKRRKKRNTSLNCSESDNEVRCCRYPLEVDFRKFNWDWIIAPTSFNAYFCNGECKLGFLQRYPHTHIMQLSTAPQPCCSPTKMSPISLLYFNNEQTLVMSTIPNMAVDKCSCS